MGSHPLNLLLRFVLEIVALVSVGLWGWNKGEHFLKYFLAIGLPLALGVIWGVFAVPDDPSRSGQTVIATSGIVRLAIELGIFTIAAIALYNQGQHKISSLFAILVIVHYLFSYDRVIWLFNQ